MNKLWDLCIDGLMALFLPLVCAYFTFSTDLFFNVACQEASGLEAAANAFMAPSQYLFMGRAAKLESSGEWTFSPRFEYTEHFALKTAASTLAVVPGFVLGTACKAAALLDPSARTRFNAMQDALTQTTLKKTNLALYKVLGIQSPTEWLTAQGHDRRPGDERHLNAEKEAMAAIGAALNCAGIPWWVDCGTCLGCYRYGGVIPWDEDVDIAVLRPDFDNVCHALNALDPAKYVVQDWSSRDFPKSYLKVLVRKTAKLIDIYGFDVDVDKREIRYVLALENALFFPEWWKIRERRFKVPVAFETVFPLKRAVFDGIEVFVPQDTQKYLQRYYGENLAPAKVFDRTTGRYERDLTHPYWQRAHVH